MSSHSDTSSSLPVLSHPPLRHIWIVIGSPGSGKSTMAEFLARNLQLPYIEGDDYLPTHIISKLSTDVLLTDTDRWGWLSTVRDKATSMSQGCVLASTCFKQRYRDFFRVMQSEGVIVRFVYLKLGRELAVERIRARRDHFFNELMADSQFEPFEEPAVDELDVGVVDASASREVVAERVLEWALGCGS